MVDETQGIAEIKKNPDETLPLEDVIDFLNPADGEKVELDIKNKITPSKKIKLNN